MVKVFEFQKLSTERLELVLQEAQSHGLVYLGEARDWWNPLWKWNDNSLVARLALPAPADLVKYDHISNIVVRKTVSQLPQALAIAEYGLNHSTAYISGATTKIPIIKSNTV